MLFPLLMMGDAGPAVNPTLGAVTVKSVAGSAICSGAGCTNKSGSNDTVEVDWTISNPNNSYFQTKVYRDGSLVGTLVNNVIVYTELAPGADGWAQGPVGYNHTFRVDVVSLVDGTVVSTQTAAAFNHIYNTTCPGPC